MTNLQAQLADFNLLVDKLNTDTEVILVQQEAQELASQNEADSREVDGLFAEKQSRLDQIHRLGTNIIDHFNPKNWVRLKTTPDHTPPHPTTPHHTHLINAS